jgi:hypothetical protein
LWLSASLPARTGIRRLSSFFRAGDTGFPPYQAADFVEDVPELGRTRSVQNCLAGQPGCEMQIRNAGIDPAWQSVVTGRTKVGAGSVKGTVVNDARGETGGPNRTPRSEIRPAVPATRKKEPVLLLDLSTSMNWGAADEYGPEWPDAGSRRAIVIEALHGLVRVLEREDSEAAAEQADGSDERGGLMTHGFGNRNADRRRSPAQRARGRPFARSSPAALSSVRIRSRASCR